MPTLTDLADLEQGFVLIYGMRRSGKSQACQVIIDRWLSRGLDFAHGHTSQATRAMLAGRQRYLIDEPAFVTEDAILVGALGVVATTMPSQWMRDRADWIVYVSPPSIVEILPGRGAVSRVKTPRTIWERLLDVV